MGTPPFSLRHIDHVVLRVRDEAAMVAFYCDVLGCSLERRQDAIGLVQLRAGASLIDLVRVDGKLGAMGGAAPGAEGRNMDHLCLRADPFDATRSWATCRRMACASATSATVTAPRATGIRSICSIPKATWSS